MPILARAHTYERFICSCCWTEWCIPAIPAVRVYVLKINVDCVGENRALSQVWRMNTWWLLRGQQSHPYAAHKGPNMAKNSKPRENWHPGSSPNTLSMCRTWSTTCVASRPTSCCHRAIQSVLGHQCSCWSTRDDHSNIVNSQLTVFILVGWDYTQIIGDLGVALNVQDRIFEQTKSLQTARPLGKGWSGALHKQAVWWTLR